MIHSKFKTSLLCGSVAVAMASAAGADTVSLFCSASGAEYQLCSDAATAWAKDTGNEVKINKMPASWDEALPLYQQLLSAKSPDIDVMLLDVVWVGMLKDQLLDLNTVVPAEEIAQHFASTVAAGSVDGKLVGMPWYADTGLMFYRKDLLEKYGKPVPKTWAEMTDTAKVIMEGERAAGNPDMWGYVWQGKSYEGLSCDAIEWLASSNGGTIVDAAGAVTVNNADAIKAVDLAASWVDTISPKGVLDYDEESSRGVFETGNSVFHRNWSYVWGTSQGADSKLKGLVGVTALPSGSAGGPSAGCMGTAHMGVSKYSAHPEAAASLLRFMTGLSEQKRRTIDAAYNPTIATLYEDAEVLAAVPFLGDARAAFDQAVSRPSSVTLGDYNQVSSAFYQAVHSVLAGETTATDAMSLLQADLEKIKARGGW
ncbi:ABC transporter substrate-binding protein [Rhodobacteraceae bacterium KMS-5]|uniref:ABC transporter substrate-binding protein n=2 Tax=Tabrizicola oligotrophica TaxID=2710650 RepID=A0A6M0QWG6_9RHOB|nr:ABC transporter substrate-binding protein [Tabrizicola oligotrophica]